MQKIVAIFYWINVSGEMHQSLSSAQQKHEILAIFMQRQNRTNESKQGK